MLRSCQVHAAYRHTRNYTAHEETCVQISTAHTLINGISHEPNCDEIEFDETPEGPMFCEKFRELRSGADLTQIALRTCLHNGLMIPMLRFIYPRLMTPQKECMPRHQVILVLEKYMREIHQTISVADEKQAVQGKT